MKTLIKPVITEKFSVMADPATKNRAGKSSYAFIVNKNANKIEIKKAVEKTYQVTVESVNTMNYIGKTKIRHTKTKIFSGTVKRAKKAVVTLKKGDTIDFYGNI
ncbi:MAG: 50S ribosomal protein L23 [Bacteroidota bacterium]